jgi:hypothetical protein
MVTGMEYITSKDQILAKGAVFPPAGQVSTNVREAPGRLDVMGQNKLLFMGRHELVYDDWRRAERSDQSLVELVVNFQRRLSRLWKALMLSEPPTITVNKDAQEWVDDLVKTSHLMGCMGSIVIDQSRWGSGLFKVTDDEVRGTKIKAQPAYIGDGTNHAGGWFPIVDPEDLQEVTGHVLAWIEHRRETVWGIQVTKKYLRAEIHERGKVTRQLWSMEGRQVRELLEDVPVETGHDGFCLVAVTNGQTSDSPFGMDDYQDLDSLLHEVELRLSQLSKVLDKHADPNLMGPVHMAGGGASPGQAAAQAAQQGQGGRAAGSRSAQQAKVNVGGKFFGLNPDDPKVEYVTWDASPEGIKYEIEILMDLVYIISETSPAAFGQMKAGLAESGSALKRLLMAPLLKVAELRNAMDEGLTEALMAANALARARDGSVPKLTSVETEWKDGLPQDKKEDAEVEVAMHGAELTSKEASIGRVYGLTGDGLKEEVAKIEGKAEDAQKAKASAPDDQAILDAARKVPAILAPADNPQ